MLDFENTAEDIEKGFQPFYDRVTLSKETDANQLYNIRTDLDKFAIHEAADLAAFAKEWFSAKRSVEKLQGVVNPVAKKWLAETEDDQVDYKSKARVGWEREKVWGPCSWFDPGAMRCFHFRLSGSQRLAAMQQTIFAAVPRRAPSDQARFTDAD